MQDLLARARAFSADDPDPATRAELDLLIARVAHGDAQATTELSDRFAGALEFGTAGLRGLLGAGENRMNRAIVIRTTAALAAYLLATVPDAKARGVVIGRDARHGSAEFAEETARVLAAAGIVAWVFPEIVPTPLVSFGVKALDAAAGVMVTASHNPPAYNGYKVYWTNSAQIIPPVDAGIAREIERVGSISAVPRMAREEAESLGLIRAMPPAVMAHYFHAIEGNQKHDEGRGDLSIVYTPMHGVGDRYAHEMFRRLGFSRVKSVPQQAAPDPTFATVKFPNPEEPGAMDLALALARSERADLVIANDPDADRLAIGVPDGAGDYVMLTGNEVGALLAHYLLVDDPHPAHDRLVVTTIVSSTLLSRIAHKLGVRYAETLTGFKWIMNTALDVQRQTGATLVMGYEEALGYSVGEITRDKDGIGAAATFAELAAVQKARGESILDRLARIYRDFGLVVSAQHNVTRPGSEGKARIAREMDSMRNAPPAAIGGDGVVAVRDYFRQERADLATGTTTPLSLPKSDVLAFEMASGTRITMRPSGTEPKIKYYFDVALALGADEPFAEGKARALQRLDMFRASFVALAEKAGE